MREKRQSARGLVVCRHCWVSISVASCSLHSLQYPQLISRSCCSAPGGSFSGLHTARAPSAGITGPACQHFVPTIISHEPTVCDIVPKLKRDPMRGLHSCHRCCWIGPFYPPCFPSFLRHLSSFHLLPSSSEFTECWWMGCLWSSLHCQHFLWNKVVFFFYKRANEPSVLRRKLPGWIGNNVFNHHRIIQRHIFNTL